MGYISYKLSPLYILLLVIIIRFKLSPLVLNKYTNPAFPRAEEHYFFDPNFLNPRLAGYQNSILVVL